MDYNSFDDLWAEVEKDDSYWSEKAILDFTIQLYRLLLTRDLSKTEFANKIEKSKAYVTKVFRGNANFTIHTMVKLVRALDGELKLHIIPKEHNVQQWFTVLQKNEKKTAVRASEWARKLEIEDAQIPQPNVINRQLENGYTATA